MRCVYGPPIGDNNNIGIGPPIGDNDVIVMLASVYFDVIIR